ncbi:MAG: ferritin family protein [Sedimentisphaerales bacterium]|nr:ferritin family protein [Sedimentisphaerales bacterium]
MAEAGPDNEIWELAIHREVEAYDFYMTLAQRIDNPEMQKIFKDLANEELEHKAKLELEILKTGRTLPLEQQFPNSTTYYRSGNIDSQLKMDYKDLLLLAIQKEEASFRTYINLLSNVYDQASRDVLLAIAEEEVKHKLRFEIEYDMLLKKT